MIKSMINWLYNECTIYSCFLHTLQNTTNQNQFFLTNSNQCFKKRTSHFNFNQLNLEPTFTKIQFLSRFDHGFILVQTI